ncbi:MAG: hypothetical protein K0S55_1603, partial [Clostridia bacterium]|nr:hypothetical protein [Clostridia bacterium]
MLITVFPVILRMAAILRIIEIAIQVKITVNIITGSKLIKNGIISNDSNIFNKAA